MVERLIYPTPVKKPREVGLILYHGQQQLSELRVNGSIPKDCEDRKSILSWYMNSEDFKRIFTKTFRFYSLYHRDAQIFGYNGFLSGKMFEDIAHAYLSGRLKKGEVLLSRDKTHAVIKGLFSRVNFKRLSYSGKSLYRLKYPDGLVIDMNHGNEVKEVYEYSVAPDENKIKKHLRLVTKLRRSKPEIFAESRPLFVFPKNQNWNLNNINVDIFYLPFDRKQWHDFLRKVTKEYRGIPSYEEADYPVTEMNASLIDVQNRIRLQIERGFQSKTVDDKKKIPLNEFIKSLNSG